MKKQSLDKVALNKQVEKILLGNSDLLRITTKQFEACRFILGKAFNGVVYEMHNKKQLFCESYYKDGKLNGPTIRYYVNGVKAHESNYTNGKIDGIKRNFHENGKLMDEGHFKNGKGWCF